MVPAIAGTPPNLFPKSLTNLPSSSPISYICSTCGGNWTTDSLNVESFAELLSDGVTADIAESWMRAGCRNALLLWSFSTVDACSVCLLFGGWLMLGGFLVRFFLIERLLDGFGALNARSAYILVCCKLFESNIPYFNPKLTILCYFTTTIVVGFVVVVDLQSLRLKLYQRMMLTRENGL